MLEAGRRPAGELKFLGVNRCAHCVNMVRIVCEQGDFNAILNTDRELLPPRGENGVDKVCIECVDMLVIMRGPIQYNRKPRRSLFLPIFTARHLFPPRERRDRSDREANASGKPE